MQEIKAPMFPSDFYSSSDEKENLVILINVSEQSVFYNGSLAHVPSKLPVLPPYELSVWGPKRDSLYIVIPITFVYITIFVTGLLGNICTCIVIARNKCMHTATNYYLFSLAISDLLLLVSGLPTEIYSTWSKYPYIFGEVFCILQGFAAETSANATVLTITAFTIERYVAICHPFLSHTMSKLSRAIKFVIIIWLLAMALALPQAMAFGIYYEKLDGRVVGNDHYVCTVTRDIIPHAFEISTFVFFIAPMSVITILYILIGVKIHKSTRGRARDGSVKLKHRKTKFFQSNPLSLDESKADKVQLTYEEEGRKNYPRNSQASKHVVKMLGAVAQQRIAARAPRSTMEEEYPCSGHDNQRCLYGCRECMVSSKILPRNITAEFSFGEVFRENHGLIFRNRNRLEHDSMMGDDQLLVAVVVAFFICWAPFHAQRLVAIYCHPDSSGMVTTFAVLTYVSGIFYYLSTTINPVLYHIMSHKFRVAFKDTIMRFLRRKPRPVGERCYSALSGRSSQVNSQSNTDSCSQQSSLRYLETEMRRLQNSRRPLVVSFRRKEPPKPKIKQVTVLDAELQRALDSLTKEKMDKDKPKLRPCIRKCNDISPQRGRAWGNLSPEFGLIELHHLESSSANGMLNTSWHCSNVDIEIFREQQLKLTSTKRSYNKLNGECLSDSKCGDAVLTKSSTMPNIGKTKK